MRTYPEALAYLNQFINYERTQPQRYAPETLSLDRVNHLLDRLGRPDRAYRSIHIAGTKGKGSTAAMIESCLRAAGYRTGFYTSPHLHTFRERLRVNNEYIAREMFAQLVDELEPRFNEVEGVTWFEIVTTLAFMFFARSRIDVAVLEVGLGGRFDATNVVTPLVSVITSLSMDHMNLLGNTIEQIAFEKAGIIKRRVPVVSAPQVPEAADVIRRVARMRGARLIVPHPPTPSPERRQHISGEGEAQSGMRLLGAHQLINASVALTALQVANERGLTITDEAMRQGMTTVQWPGRLEVLSHDPLLVVDGAHNGDSAQKLATALRDVFHIDQWTLIVGVSADKDIPAILDGLLPIAEHVIVTQASNSRAAKAETLGAQIGDRGVEPTLTNTVAEAIDLALKDRSPIIITGSLFTVADAREAWFARIGQPLEKD
ncbi:MAG TPA: folylpolyglutamate synthase/dihydrofolate synthase family protein [Anaerolineae bacterium]|nr:folylpolyglutamate synthase/dihydrofolate synthase family protein [Anaerolineae bacterium]